MFIGLVMSTPTSSFHLSEVFPNSFILPQYNVKLTVLKYYNIIYLMLPNKERKKMCVCSCTYPIRIVHIIMEAEKSQDP